MKSPWLTEIQRIAGLLIVTLLFGFFSGYYLLPLAIVILAYLAWHLYNLTRLLRWLHEGKGHQPPESSGIWDDVFESLQRHLQRNNKRKKDLRRHLKRFHKMVAALPDAAVELRADDEIEWWNEAAARYIGLKYPRDVGQRIGNLLRHPDLQQYFMKQDYEEAIEIPAPVDENITLHIRVISYTRNRRLLIARDMTRIQWLERTRKDFVANASHELRSPLTVLGGYLETLVDAEESSRDYLPQLRSMQAQTERMTRIVDDLMLLSKLESEASRVDQLPVNMPKLLEHAINQAKELSGLEGHEFSSTIDENLCLLGRESELYSAISNLLFNAVRYTPPGGEIKVSWQDTSDGPVFSVADTGVGIAPHHVPRLTERFYRVDAGRSRATGGTGLGLAIVKHVLHRHHTRLDIESEVGQGSTFSCKFDADRRQFCQM